LGVGEGQAWDECAELQGSWGEAGGGATLREVAPCSEM
jgi:hypothetical protein